MEPTVTLDTKALERHVILLLASAQTLADTRRHAQVEPEHVAFVVLESPAGAALARARGQNLAAMCEELGAKVSAFESAEQAKESYLSARTLEVVNGTARLAQQLGAPRADLSMLMRVLLAHGYLPECFTAPWSSEERALVAAILEPAPVPTKPVRRPWGPELAIRELRRELEATVGSRAVGAIEAERLLGLIDDRLVGFDVTPDVGRVDLERDGKTITLEWNEETSHLELTVRAGDLVRARAFAWSIELGNFVDEGGNELLPAFRSAVIDLTRPAC